MSEGKYVSVRPRFQNERYRNIAGVMFEYGIADCSNLDDAGFAKICRYMSRTYRGKAISDGEYQAQAGRPGGAVSAVPSDVPANGGAAPGPAPVSTVDAPAPAGDAGASSSGDGSERSEADKIREAVELLESDDSDHWTAEGLPRIDAVAELSGLQGVTRDQINIAAPDALRPAQD